MSVILEDMEFPNSCKECKLKLRIYNSNRVYNDQDVCWYCSALNWKQISPHTIDEMHLNERRLDDCPLINGSPHEMEI